jgi:hypothetical protein
MATAAPLQPTPAHKLAEAFPEDTNLATSPISHITPPSGTVTASLNFYSPPADGSAPWNYVEPRPDNLPQRNYSAVTHPVAIDDLRGHEHEHTLASSAFEALRGVPSAMRYVDWDDDARVRRVYYPEVERTLLAAVPGAARVFLFDHTIRRAQPNAKREPVLRVHIDQTPASAAARVAHHLPDEAEALLRGRYRLINVWRPLAGPVVSLPLAYAAGSSVRDEELVGVEHRYPNRVGETAGVKHAEGQRWYYWSGMKEDERVLLQCFDSADAQGRVPHTAFVDPRTKEDWPARESVEVRALVFG